MATYRLTIDPGHRDVRRTGDVEFRCQFREGSRTRHRVQGAEWVLSPGDTITTDDVAAIAALADHPHFTRDDGAARGLQLDDDVFDRYRTERAAARGATP